MGLPRKTAAYYSARAHRSLASVADSERECLTSLAGLEVSVGFFRFGSARRRGSLDVPSCRLPKCITLGDRRVSLDAEMDGRRVPGLPAYRLFAAAN